MHRQYNDKFYRYQEGVSLSSAKEIVPIVMERLGRPNSVLDLGCGRGAWLSVFREHGTDKITGVDGNYVNKEKLLIEKKDFIGYDLQKPLNLEKKYDLAMSVEVAEHIPAEYANIFVQNLCSHSDVVLFSAAIPDQGGRNHVNEQYPSYWAELFGREGYICFDILRPAMWKNKGIQTSYRQNIMLYARNTSSAAKRLGGGKPPEYPPLDVIHPDLFKHPSWLLRIQWRIIKTLMPTTFRRIKQ